MAYDPFIGTTLGSYEVLEAVGEGGMARIYRGVHAELERNVAIKVVNWGLQEDPEFTERFRREAQAIATLRHPNIVQIFDFGKHDNGYFMVMEFIGGGDLAQLLKKYRDRQELLPKEDILRYSKGIASALDYAHAQEVIHRDIKPSNIMLTSQGQPILTDFGLVMLPTQRSQATLGNTFGTPHYVAPEQAISSAAALPASDLYSLGIILFEMITGELPFDDESPLSVALKHVSDPPPTPTSINPDIPRDVEKVILKALAKNQEDRFPTATELISSLESAWAGTLGQLESAEFPVRAAPATIPIPVIVPPPPPASQISDHALPVMPPPPTDTQPTEKVSNRPKIEKIKQVTPIWVIMVASTIGALLMFIGIYVNSYINTPASATAVVIVSTPTNSSDSFVPPTATETPTPIPTVTPTALPPTETPTDIPTETPTNTPTSTDTSTPLPTDTPLPTVTPTQTPTPTPTLTPTPTPTLTPSPTNTPVPTPVPVIITDPLDEGPVTREKLVGKILFKTGRDGATSIYRMDADGSNQVPLPREAWYIYSELQAQLPFSAVSKEQVVPQGDGQLDLWLIDLNDGSRRRITSTGKDEYDAAWSPLDLRVAYVSEETGRTDIYLVNLGGSANERLTTNENFDKHPTWSPDAKKIAFWSDRGLLGKRQIWVIDLNSREVRSLSDNPFEDYDPVWVR
ncbi:protein kinase [Anaerolineales bacterium HSG25]|nr:protein kinase [Anaerolineales bacterium HSG25]